MPVNRTWYREVYLKSVHWKQLRLNTLQSQGRICCKCGSMKRLQVHHLTYARLWKELPTDLIVVCRSCHEKLHGIQHQKQKRKTRSRTKTDR